MPTDVSDDAFAGLAEAHRDAYLNEKEGAPNANDEHEVAALSEGLELPSDEDKLTLRRVSDTIPWNTYLVAYAELAERFSYYGCTTVFTNFIQQPLPPNSSTGAGGTNGQSGALGLGQRASTGLTTFNTFWVYVVPLFGAYVADTYWGRYKTIGWSVFVAIIGHILLIISAVPGVIDNSHGSLACFVIAIIIMGVGTGGFKSNISPLVAEQYKGTLHVQTKKSGERVLVDPVYTTQRIYMYFYLFINIGALIGPIGMTYAEKYIGYWLSYTLPTIVFLSVPIVLYAGRNRYVRSPPQGSVLSRAFRILRTAARGRISLNPIATWRSVTASDFWESAKPSAVKSTGGEKPAWLTWDDKWVDEVSRGFKACKVFIWFPIYWLTYNQINNNLTSQAATMSTHGLPNDVIGNLDPFALIILIPIFDRIIYPALSRAGIRFTPIKRMTMGFFMGTAAMIWAAVVQHYIYKTNPCGYQASTCKDAHKNVLVSPLNVWIQTGSYVLIAMSEIMASITGLEYAFTKAPRNMRSLVMAAYLFATAVSDAIGEAFVSLSADPLLVWNYGSMAVLAAVAGVGFWFTFRDLDAQEDRLNDMQVGHSDLNAPGPDTASEVSHVKH